MRLHIYPCTLWYGKSRVPPLFSPFMFLLLTSTNLLPPPTKQWTKKKPTIKNILDKLKMYTVQKQVPWIFTNSELKRIFWSLKSSLVNYMFEAPTTTREKKKKRNNGILPVICVPFFVCSCFPNCSISLLLLFTATAVGVTNFVLFLLLKNTIK